MTISAAMRIAAITVTARPEATPSVLNTVAVASTAEIASEVSQPIDVSHEMMPGSFCPCTPNAARESTIVGALPRFPAIATSPHSAKLMTMPITATTLACQKLMPKPSR